MRARHALAVALTLALPATVAAQRAPIVGTWQIEWELGRTMTVGGDGPSAGTPIMAKGTMAVAVAGDSLVATVTASSRSDGQPLTRPPFTMGGRANATGAVFTQISEATLNMNGEERKQRVVSTWTLQVAADELTGTVSRAMEGLMVDMHTTPVKGSRGR
jgi:hypothetical protein